MTVRRGNPLWLPYFKIPENLWFSTYQPPYQKGNQGTIRFEVEDSGEGIAAEDLEVIFLPFQQVGKHNRNIEGTGLGLSISQKLVKMMGGQLQVRSVLGVGTLFLFEIPLQESNFALPEIGTPKPTIIGFKIPSPLIEAGTNSPISQTEGDFRILVVDDNRENCAVLTNLLTPLGFNVLEANDGRDALTKAPAFYPDVIIMEMDGLECARRLRQDAQFKKTVIIALSASVFKENQQSSLEAGCNVFLTKPINADKLLQTFAEHCSLEWIYDTSTAQNPQTVATPAAEIIPPDVEPAKALFKLAKSGDVQAVIIKAQTLLETQPHLQPFIQDVCQLAKRLQITKLKKFLEPYIFE